MSASNNPQNLVQAIDSLIEELDQLAVNPHTSSRDFFSRLKDTLDAVIQTESSAVFLFGPDGTPILANNDGSKNRIEDWFPRWSTARAELESSEKGFIQQNRAKHTAIGFSLAQNESLQGILVALIDSAQCNQATLSLMQALADVTSRFLNLQTNRSIAGETDFLSQVNEFSLGCLSSFDEQEVGKIVVNDARMLLRCERVQYFRVSGNHLKLAAVSSVAVFEKRSELLRCASLLAQLVCRSNQPLLSSQPSSNKNIQNVAETYKEMSGMPFFALFPLQAKFRQHKQVSSSGVILIEYAQLPDSFEFVRAAKIVVPQAGLAVYNARRVSSIPFYQSLMFISDGLRLGSLAKGLLLIGLPMALVLMTFLIPADFKIRLGGTLRPTKEQLVFSPHDAFVEKVLVEHGDLVASGDVLVQLRSPALDLELEETVKEIVKLSEFKSAKTIALNQVTNRNADDPSLLAKLASEIADLEFQIADLRDKQSFVQRRIDELSIHAPIAGRVVTWNVQKMLTEKPVRWGDPLLKVADEESQWELQLKASEKKIGYLLAAQSELESPNDVPVEYFFQSNPDRKFQTKIRETADSTEMDPEFGPSVAVLCDIDRQQQLKRHGAKVVADVDCGKRSIAYVWTYELVDAIRRQFVW